MFRILADECIHQDLIWTLKKAGLDILGVSETNLKGVSDDSVFNFAIKSKRILLTFDREFGNFFRFDIGKSAGIVIILIGQMQREEIIKNTLDFFKNIKQKDLSGELIIISKNKVRIRSFLI